MSEQNNKVKASQAIEWILSKVGLGYVYGAIGQVCTIKLLQQLQIMYGSLMGEGYYQKAGDYTKGRCSRWLNKVSFDCSGLIKAARKSLLGVWCDVSAQGTYDQCTKRGVISTMPLIPGCTVYMYSANKKRMGHVGIYIGNGKVIEARGADFGVVITKLSDRAWGFWGLLDWMIYDLSVEKNPLKISSSATTDAGDGTTPKVDDPHDPIEDTIDNAIEDGAITASDHWKSVLNGELPCNPKWLKVMMDNYHNLLNKASKGGE